MRTGIIIALGVLGVILLGNVHVHAGPIVEFDFQDGDMDDEFGNLLNQTDPVTEISATLTGWSYLGGGGGATEGNVRRWPTGVGECNQNEGMGCSSPQHAVDNDGSNDVLLIQFSESLLLTSAVISAWSDDFDVTFWGGTGLLDIDDMTLPELDAASLSGRLHDDFDGDVDFNGETRTVDLSSQIDYEVDWLVFGARVGSDRHKDHFKFKLLTTEVPDEEVPAPGVVSLIGAGALAFYVRRRRKPSR